MIVGLKSNVPYIIRSVPETEIKRNWLKEEIFRVIDALNEVGFSVREVARDNHPSNVSAFREITSDYVKESDELRGWINIYTTIQYIQYNIFTIYTIYLLYDLVHLTQYVHEKDAVY